MCVAMAWLLPGAALAAEQNGPAGASSVLVFFDWGKPEIRSDAAGTLDAVAERFRVAPVQRLRVSGHSDRSGGTAGNRRSAKQRADAVAEYLAARGVPRDAMAIVAFGEERPLIPTGDGVREPQNRRVEIGFVGAAGQ